MKAHFKYLGLEVASNHIRVCFQEDVIDKIRKTLDRQKGKFLSLAGRVCLFRLVLSSIPMFYTSFFRIPFLLVQSIKKIQRKVLWDQGKEGKKIAWVVQDKVCEPKDNDGLGIKGMTSSQRVVVDRLPTLVNLKERGAVLESFMCVMCGEEEETRNHLFFKCNVAWRV